MADEKSKPEILHRTKFMGGELTPTEAHRKYAFGGKRCAGCKTAPAVMRIRVLVPMEEAYRKAPNYLAALAATNKEAPGQVPTTQLKESAGDKTGKPYFMASNTVWCASCRVQAQIEAAHGAPSWAVVEIDEGPKDTIQVGYGN